MESNYENVLNEVLTISEIQEHWPYLKTITIRTYCLKNKFTPGNYRKSGSTWIITKKDALKFFGNPIVPFQNS